MLAPTEEHKIKAKPVPGQSGAGFVGSRAAGAAGADACRRGGGVKGGAVYGALRHADKVEQLIFRVGGGVQLGGCAAVDAVGDRHDAALCKAGQRFFQRLRVAGIALFGERRRELGGGAGLIPEQEGKSKLLPTEMVREQTAAEPDTFYALYGGTLLFLIVSSS